MRLLSVLFTVLITAVSLRAQSYSHYLALFSNSPACNGQSFKINVGFSLPSGNSSFSFRWSGPNSFTSTASTLTIPASAATAGVYSVTMTYTGTSSGTATESTTLALGTPKPDALVSYLISGGYRVSGSSYQICSPTSFSLIGNPDQVGSTNAATYRWTGPNGFSSNQQSPAVSAGVIGLYIVEATYPNGCGTGKDTVTISNFDPPVYAASYSTGPNPQNSALFCPGSSVEFRGSTSVTLPVGITTTYQWSGPNGFTSSAQNFTLTNLTTAMAGSYSVTATFSGACSATATTSRTIQVGVPYVGAFSAAVTSNGGSSYSTFCPGSNIHVYASPAYGGATYQWQGPNGYPSTAASFTLTSATPAMSGAYSLTTTIAEGCSTTATATVIVGTPSVSTISFNLATNSVQTLPFCPGTSARLLASVPAGIPATYQWSGPNGFTSSAQSFTLVNLTTAMAGLYNVTATLGGTCSATTAASLAIRVSAPVVSAFAGNDNGGSPENTFCLGTPFVLSAYPVNATMYQWSGPNGFVSSARSITVASTTPATAGIYSVTATVTGGCSGVGSTTVTIGTPTVRIQGQTVGTNPVSTSRFCTGSTFELRTTAQYSASATYWWRGPNGFTSTAPSVTLTNATAAMTGTYSLTVTIVDGCVSSASTFINIGSAAFSANAAIAGSTSLIGSAFCPGSSVQLYVYSLNAVPAIYQWSGPNGFTGSGQSLTLANATAAMNGVYTVTAVVTGECSGTYTARTQYITFGKPLLSVDVRSPDFTFALDDTYCPGSSVYLTAGTTPANAEVVSYQWQGPGGFASSGQSLTLVNLTPAMSGIYSLTAVYGGQCAGARVNFAEVKVGPPRMPIAMERSDNSGILGGTFPMCPGERYYLSASFLNQPLPADNQYLWTLPNGTTSTVRTLTITAASAADGGRYILQTTFSGQCAGVVRDTADVLFGLPQPTLYTGRSVVATGNGTTLLAQGCYGSNNVRWSDGKTGRINTVTPTQTTTYTAVCLYGGCEGVASTPLTVRVSNQPEADLSLAMHVGDRAPALNQPIGVTLTVMNSSSAAATNVQVTSRLAASLNLIDAGSMQATGSVLTGSVASVPANGSAVLTFRVASLTAGTTRLAAQVVVTDNPDPDSSPNSGTNDGQDDVAWVDLRTQQPGATVSESPEPMPAFLPNASPVFVDLPPGSTDLSLDLSINTLTPTIGEVVSVTIQVNNYDDYRLLSPNIICQLPPGLSFLEGNGFTATGQDILLTGGAYYSIWPRRFTFLARITAPINEPIKVQISSCDWDDVDSTPGNGYDTGEDDTAQISLRVR